MQFVALAVLTRLLSADGGTTTDAGADAGPPAIPTITFNFDSEDAGLPPRGMLFRREGKSHPGHWVVQPAVDAPSAPNVVTQVDPHPGERAPILLTDANILRDVAVSARCRPLEGKQDQSCGVVFRFRDEKNHYAARANALTRILELYVLENDEKRVLGTARIGFEPDAWHSIKVEAIGSLIRVSFDEKKLIFVRDFTFVDVGRSGLLTRGDSVTQYDDFSVGPASRTKFVFCKM